MPIILQNDEPTDEDTLNREELVNEIVCAATHCQPPMVLGLHGDWGSGKTSLMNQIKNKLKGNDKIVCISFEAWRYQDDPVPIAALLYEMREQFPVLKTFSNASKKLAEIGFQTMLSNLSHIAKLIALPMGSTSPAPLFLTDKVQSFGENYDKQHIRTPLTSIAIRKELKDCIDELLPKQGKNDSNPTKPRVVVFIDDLDRCHADMAYRFLEGLKIYLNLDNCVFILAMNQHIIVEAIASVMKREIGDKEVELRADAYLEKLCANIWRLPQLQKPEEFFKICLQHGDSTHHHLPLIEAIELLTTRNIFLPPNPRRLKALANLYLRFWHQVHSHARVKTALSSLALNKAGISIRLIFAKLC